MFYGSCQFQNDSDWSWSSCCDNNVQFHVNIILCLDCKMHHLFNSSLWHLFNTIYIWSTFSAIKTISGHLRQVDHTECSTVPQHIPNKRFGQIFVLLWNKFHPKPISSICDCQHCLAITQSKWVFLHRLINKRHYCSLMSSSPCLSVGCVNYNCHHSFPLKSTLLLGLGCKGLFCFSLAGFCCHLLSYSATVLRTITSHNTYYYVSSMTVLEKGELNKCKLIVKVLFCNKMINKWRRCT